MTPARSIFMTPLHCLQKPVVCSFPMIPTAPCKHVRHKRPPNCYQNCFCHLSSLMCCARNCALEQTHLAVGATIQTTFPTCRPRTNLLDNVNIAARCLLFDTIRIIAGLSTCCVKLCEIRDGSRVVFPPTATLQKGRFQPPRAMGRGLAQTVLV